MKPATIERIQALQAQLRILREDVISLECDVDVEALDHDGDDGYPFEDASSALNDLVIDIDAAVNSLDDVVRNQEN